MSSRRFDPVSHACLLASIVSNSCRGSVRIASDVDFPRPFHVRSPSALFISLQGVRKHCSEVRPSITLFASTMSRLLQEAAGWGSREGIGKHGFANSRLLLLASAFAFLFLESFLGCDSAFTSALVESALRIRLLQSRLRKSLRGAGFTASQARFLGLFGRLRCLQRFP